ncbi:glycosyltransferase [Pseudomonas oryzihabitans]|uniref:glycosyltransferase n=1 Tax=Pseudomonas oryzihabitans TaxID=47885 RepID=UPI003627DDC0
MSNIDKWIYYPDYSATNPYQVLLAKNLPERYEGLSGDIDMAVEMITRPDAGRVVFHLHWINPILNGCKNEFEAEREKEKFLAKVRVFIDLGGELVWTVHNKISHDAEFLSAQLDLSEQLTRLASAVHVHSDTERSSTAGLFEIPRQKLIVQPHPNYIGVYDNYVTRKTAKIRLGIPLERTVISFIGQLRPYKGLDELASVFKEILKERSDVHLIIAGKPAFPYKQGTVGKLLHGCKNITVVERFIEGTELQWYFNASDCVVLPYKNVLNSGSVLNALSFSRPVIAPAIGAIPDHVTEGVNGWLYDPSIENDLQSKLKIFLDLDEIERENIFTNSYESVKEFTWDVFSRELAEKCDSKFERFSFKIKTLTDEHQVVASRMPGENSRKSIAVVILNYENIQDSERLVKSLESMDGNERIEVFLIDNNSAGTCIGSLRSIAPQKEIPYTCIQTSANLGYAAANNIGVVYAMLEGFEHIWIINADAVVKKDSLTALLDAADKYPGTSVFGSCILYGNRDNSIWFAGAGADFSNGLRTSHWYNGKDPKMLPEEPYETDYVTGASLFCRRETFITYGLIPEDYFLYFEETDWCLQIRKKGGSLKVVPNSKLVHYKRSERNGLPSKYYFYYYVRNSINFTRKFSPENLNKTVFNMRNGFVKDWLQKINLRKPDLIPAYQRIADKAIKDGQHKVVGFFNDLDRLFAGAETPTFYDPEENYEGYLDNLDALKVEGWCRRLSGSGNVLVTLSIDGAPVASQEANIYREDLKKAGKGNGKYGFCIDIPQGFRDYKAHNLQIMADNNVLIKKSAFCSTYLPKYKGRIDGLSNGIVKGWAYNESNKRENIFVELIVNNQQRYVAKADIYRADLDSANVGDGAHAFEIKVASKFSTDCELSLELRLAGSEQKLHSTTKVQSGYYTDVPKGLSLTEQLDWIYYNRQYCYWASRYSNLDRFYTSNIARLANVFKEEESLGLISVVMPAFNREATIYASISSVINQTYKNWELIIVDDGSEDETVEIVKKVVEENQDLSIVLIQNEKNVGVSAARNLALSKCSGKFVAYLDSDNDWHHDYLKIMVGYISHSTRRKSAYSAQDIYQVLYTQGGTEKDLVWVRGGEFNPELIENRNYIDLNCFVHLRELYEQYGGFNENLRRLVDWELIWRFSLASPPAFVPARISNYYIGLADNQITKIESFSNSFEQVKSLIAARLERGMVKSTQASITKPVVLVVTANEIEALNSDKFSELLSMANIVAIHCFIACGDTPSPNLYRHPLMQYHFNTSCLSSLEFVNHLLASGIDVLLLDSDSIVDHVAIANLQEACYSANDVCIVVPKRLTRNFSDTRFPYATKSLPFDVNISLIDRRSILCERRAPSIKSYELLDINHFCTYISSLMRNHYSFNSQDAVDITGELVFAMNYLRTFEGLRSIYSPTAVIYE